MPFGAFQTASCCVAVQGWNQTVRNQFYRVIQTDDPISDILVKFVGKSYYGTVDASVGTITEAIIKSLQNNTLKDVKGLTYSGITMDYGKVVYAYPADFGNLSSIKDVPNNINYTNSFTKTVVSVDGISYNCYTQNDPAASSNVQLTFA